MIRPHHSGRAGRSAAPLPGGLGRALDPGWTPDGVPAIARSLGLPGLGDHHWKVITCCREEAARTGHAPRLSELTALTGFDEPLLHELFPGDFDTTLRRVAGVSPGA